MKYKMIILGFVSFFMNECRSQSTTLENYQEKIIGAWEIDDDSSDYKLNFTENGKLKEYENNTLLSTYDFSIVYQNCNGYSASGTFFLRWTTEDADIVCFMISNLTDEYLSIMIIDKGKNLLFHRDELELIEIQD